MTAVRAGQPLDLSEVTYVKRIVIGSTDPTNPKTEEQVAEAMGLLNRCLAGPPRGKVIGSDRSFAVLQLGEHNVVLQWTTYQVGFARRPFWLND